MASPDRLGADHLRAAAVAYAGVLERHRAAINQLNVYPVPDGDTGTNMSLTVKSVVAELDEAGGGLVDVCAAISHGSLMGARGNSGVILSQLLRGLCGVLRDHGDGVDAEGLARAMSAASDAAYGAVMKPVEGTILTVAREAATAATAAAGAGAGLLVTVERSRESADHALQRTPEQLAVLAEAGVVDAGGTGFLLLLDALLHVLDGRDLPDPPAEVGPVPRVGAERPDDHEPGIADLRYEVMFLLDAPDPSIDRFKADWASIGDSIVVVGGDGTWNCHIHTDDIGGAIEAGIRVGRPSSIRVTDLLDEVAHVESIESPGEISLAPAEPAVTAVVAVAAGPGVRRIFESLGVQAVVTGGQTMNPSTEVLVQAVEQVPADHVLVLPNNKNIIPVAEQVDGLTAKSVAVVPTRGIAEGFASLLAYDPQADLDANLAGMVEAAEAVVAGEVTRAVRPSKADGFDIREGDYLGIRREGIVAVAGELVDAATGLLAVLVTAEHEIVTLIEGAETSPETTEAVVAWLGEHRPEVEVEVHPGGQPLYAYYVGVE